MDADCDASDASSDAFASLCVKISLPIQHQHERVNTYHEAGRYHHWGGGAWCPGGGGIALRFTKDGFDLGVLDLPPREGQA